jgi:hypothetical protein
LSTSHTAQRGHTHVGTGVGKVAVGVVRRDSVATPARHRDTERFDVVRVRREVDAIDERRDRLLVADGDRTVLDRGQRVHEGVGTRRDVEAALSKRLGEGQVRDRLRGRVRGRVARLARNGDGLYMHVRNR